MDKQVIDQVRSFNRLMTERVGVLNDHYLGLNHPLGEARFLWEIGSSEDKVSVRDLRQRLGLDSAYVSRLLRSLERQGLIVVKPTESDGRVRLVELTEAGRRERAELEQRAENFACSVLEPLNEPQRVKLAEAMAQVERLLLASMLQIEVADPTSQQAQWCFTQYFTELASRFEAGFNPELSISANAEELSPPKGLMLIARLREEPVGCGAVKFHETGIAEIKRMWVAPQARGLGLGRRLLVALEKAGQEAGMKVVHLETNRTLSEAIAMYRQSGYQEVEAFNDEPYAHHWFEKQL